MTRQAALPDFQEPGRLTSHLSTQQSSRFARTQQPSSRSHNIAHRQPHAFCPRSSKSKLRLQSSKSKLSRRNLFLYGSRCNTACELANSWSLPQTRTLHRSLLTLSPRLQHGLWIRPSTSLPTSNRVLLAQAHLPSLLLRRPLHQRLQCHHPPKPRSVTLAADAHGSHQEVAPVLAPLPQVLPDRALHLGRNEMVHDPRPRHRCGTTATPTTVAHDHQQTQLLYPEATAKAPQLEPPRRRKRLADHRRIGPHPSNLKWC